METRPAADLAGFLEEKGVTQTELAAALGMELPTLNRKLRGHRPWRLEEANAVLAFLRERLHNPGLTLDDLFGEAAADPDRRT